MPENMERELDAVTLAADGLRASEEVGTPSVFSCPECHGVLWEVEDGKLLTTFPSEGSVNSIAFSPNGRALACTTSVFKEPGTLDHSSELRQ